MANDGNTIVICELLLRIYLLYVQLFIFALVGEQLNRETENIQIAVYDISWYKMDSKIVKDIIFIMMRTRYPFQLTAGKMYPLNYQNFLGIIRTIASYFSVLRLIFISNE